MIQFNLETNRVKSYKVNNKNIKINQLVLFFGTVVLVSGVSPVCVPHDFLIFYIILFSVIRTDLLFLIS